MKKCSVLLFLLCLSTAVLAQQANFQGKLYSNGQPENGLHTIQFFIGAPLNWSSVPKTISVENGLYSTVIDFPANLFDHTTASRDMIVILDNNNPIDTVTIFAPLERDPTVRSYILDSITWENVHNKPTVDTSFSNEIQALTFDGDSLGISGGNKIALSHLKSPTVYGQLKVIDTAIHQSFSALGSYTTCNGNTNQSYWQSFRATENGKLRQITVPVAASCNNYVIVYIYSGQGVGSQYLGYKNCPVTSTLGLQTLDLSNGLSSSAKGYISLAVGEIYTFQLTPPVGCSISVGCNNANPYADGISSIGTTTDIPFAVFMDKSAPPKLVVNASGAVGIGVDSPTTQLEVKGRIKDQTGYVMPVGAVLPFAGSVIPEGWLLCDGRAVSRIVYADLFAAIGTAHGTGDGVTTFNLPDNRGKFLRGVDNSPTEGTSNSDPDRAARVASRPGGNTGNQVGSVQTDTVGQHTHTIPSTGVPASGLGYVFAGGVTPPGFTTNTNASGGSETRPKNAYVYYIIKY